ncbi:MAG: outer membrane lipid asymmetry maintenance protein MlaD [Gammaproteobacteria bacterium RIFCSPHIGHO2_12_FULL_42_10]|nr:MAG: outer membrane lipid asymmetry maintenance protein MlaD [Gammaproteobacteria bacterium RIFCSPHIGHO2_12_FULL_42_10]
MHSQKLLESLVGLLILLATIMLALLAFKVSGLTNFLPAPSFHVNAAFNDIGGLKVKAPVKMSGVQIGEVTRITLDSVTYKAIVTMRIGNDFNDIPDDSSAGIYTAGLLGDNYVALTPMYSKSYLKDGSQIEFTHSAMILEKLIGQLIYKLSGDQHATSEK